MRTILLTGAGGPAARALARQLRAHNFWLVGVDMCLLPRAVAELYDEVLTVPPVSDSKYLSTIRQMVDTRRIDLLIPTVQEELPQLAAAKPSLEAEIIIADADAVGLAHDKLLTMRVLEEQKVPIPLTVAGEDHLWDLPVWNTMTQVIVKPRRSRGGRGVSLQGRPVTDAKSVDFAGMLVQQFACGDEYAVQVYVSRLSEREECVVLRKTALKQGNVGNAASAERTVDSKVAEVAVNAVHALGLTGPVDVDVRKDERGTPLVLEVNARFGAQSELAPELVAAMLLDSVNQWKR